MSREIRILAYAVAGVVVARALVLAVDAAVLGWRRRNLYQS